MCPYLRTTARGTRSGAERLDSVPARVDRPSDVQQTGAHPRLRCNDEHRGRDRVTKSYHNPKSRSQFSVFYSSNDTWLTWSVSPLDKPLDKPKEISKDKEPRAMSLDQDSADSCEMSSSEDVEMFKGNMTKEMARRLVASLVPNRAIWGADGKVRLRTLWCLLLELDSDNLIGETIQTIKEDSRSNGRLLKDLFNEVLAASEPKDRVETIDSDLACFRAPSYTSHGPRSRIRVTNPYPAHMARAIHSIDPKIIGTPLYRALGLAQKSQTMMEILPAIRECEVNNLAFMSVLAKDATATSRVYPMASLQFDDDVEIYNVLARIHK